MAKQKKEKEEILDGIPESYEMTELFDKPIIPTALDTVNWFLGGGVPMSTIIELAGSPKSGKSSFAYHSAAEFQKKFPDGQLIILDSESSAEPMRLKMMGVNTDKAYLIPIGTLENGFVSIQKILTNLLQKKKDKKIMFIWDSIAMPPTEAQAANPDEKNPGGMNERQRIIKAKFQIISPLLTNNISLWIINQVYLNPNITYGDPMVTGGGMGFKHGQHFSFLFKESTQEFDGFIEKYKISKLSIKKSKFTPGAKDITMVINAIEGGMIDRCLSTLNFMIDIEIIKEEGGWVDFLGKKFRRGNLYNFIKANPIVYDYLRILFLEYVANKSSYLRLLYSKTIGIPKDLDDVMEVTDYIISQKKELEKQVKKLI